MLPKMKSLLAATGGLAVAALPAVAIADAAPADVVNQVLQTQAQVHAAAAQSQATVDKLADETQRLLDEYLVAKQQVDRLRLYNEHIEKLIRSQEEEKINNRKQLQDIEVIEKEIVPLMVRMVDTLDQFVKLDVPFLLEERTRRVNDLKAMMDSANVTISEKYRRVMEAYQIETDYGRTIEAYRGTLKGADGSEREVDFLRVGRILLAYQTLDREETGFWNRTTRQWEELDDEYRLPITNGLRIARKQVAPDLMTLPVSAPEQAK